jgi:cyclopropane fatty-acyl-phospholipid synthase-like methyltransferase
MIVFLYFLATALLIVFVVSISWTTLRGAPWLPTGIKTVVLMLTLAEPQPDDLVYDLGCGDGRILVTAVRRFGARAVGIELDPLRYLWCQLLVAVLGYRKRVNIIYGDFFKLDLSRADVVTCYLLQPTNEKLEAKLLRELKPGTRVVSHAFTFPNMKMIARDRQAKVYCYRIEG